MATEIEVLEKALENIEYRAGTGWLEKWVHEIKELEFSEAPTKNYRELEKKIPPLAALWCKARDEMVMSSLTGTVKMVEVIMKSYQIGISIQKCFNLQGFDDLLNSLKSQDKYIFENAAYTLAIAAGYSDLGYKPVLEKHTESQHSLHLLHQDQPVQLICLARNEFTEKDYNTLKFWHILSMEIGRRLTFHQCCKNIFLTALVNPQEEDIKVILEKIFMGISDKEKHLNLDINSKYKAFLMPSDNPEKLKIPNDYEFGTVIGNSVLALKLTKGSDRENTIFTACNTANNIADKKIPTILYVDIPISHAEKTDLPLSFFVKQIKNNNCHNYKSLSEIVITADLFSPNKPDLSNDVTSSFIKNEYANITLPDGFTFYLGPKVSI